MIYWLVTWALILAAIALLFAVRASLRAQTAVIVQGFGFVFALRREVSDMRAEQAALTAAVTRLSTSVDNAVAKLTAEQIDPVVVADAATALGAMADKLDTATTPVPAPQPQPGQ